MIFPYDKKFETQTTIRANPKRSYRLASRFGDEGIEQRREGDLVPFLERSSREKLVGSRINETAWAETTAEDKRLAFIADQKIENLNGWLNSVREVSENSALRNRLFPRSWSSDPAVTRLFMAEQAVLHNHKGLGLDWDIKDWNCLSFWNFPKTSYESEFIKDAIEVTRSRAVAWRNLDNIYASPSGSVTIDFWIAPRLSSDIGESGCILNVPGIISLALYPEPISNTSSSELGASERFRIVAIKESVLGAEVDAIQDFFNSLASPVINGNTWNSLGYLATPALIERGSWNHVTMVYNAPSNQFSFFVNKEVIFDLSFSTNQQFWFNSTTSLIPEGFCLGGRLRQDGSLGDEFEFDAEDNEYGDPLCADLHSFRIWGRPLSRKETLDGIGGVQIRKGLLFEACFFFNSESPSRPHLNKLFVPEERQEKFPINTELAWEYGAVVLNLDGYLYDSAGNNFGLGVGFLSESFSIPDGTYEDIARAISVSYSMRNSSILPNDNQNVLPNEYSAKISVSGRITNPNLNYSFLNNIPNVIIPVDNFTPIGFTYPAIPEGGIRINFPLRFPVLQRLRTPRTRGTTFIEIQNLFFGSKILEDGFRTEYNLGAEFIFSLIDLYSADPEDPTFPSTPEELGKLKEFSQKVLDDKNFRRGIVSFVDNSLGEIIRSEPQFSERDDEGNRGKFGKSLKIGSLDRYQGMGAIHCPAVWGKGKYYWRVDLTGERSIIVNEYIVPFPAGEVESSNPNWKEFYSSKEDLPNKSVSPRFGDNNTVGITEVFLYDKNLNAVMKAKMAQPIYRTPADNLAFKFKVDF